jgi:hypothetical protein
VETTPTTDQATLLPAVVYWVDASNGQWTVHAASVTAFITCCPYQFIGDYTDVRHDLPTVKRRGLLDALQAVVTRTAAVLVMPKATYDELPPVDQQWIAWLLDKHGGFLHTIPNQRKGSVS